MKKIILVLIVFFNLIPYINHQKLTINGATTVQAQNSGLIGAGNGVTTAITHGPVSSMTGWNYVGSPSGHGHPHGGGGGDEIGEENGDYDVPDDAGWDGYDDDTYGNDDGDIFAPAGSGGHQEPRDCAGVEGGSAFIDHCGNCVWGTTGLTPCMPPGYYLTVNNDPTKYYSNDKIYIPLSNADALFHLTLHYDNGPLDASVIDWYVDGNLKVSQSLTCDFPDTDNKYIISITKSGEDITYNVMDVYGWVPCSYTPGGYIDPCGNCSYQNQQCQWGYENLGPFVYTNHEVDVWNQLYAEDAQTESNIPGQCHGTLRTGNFRWPGTFEHWLIMIDWVFQNPLTHDVEFAIPNASASGTAWGYADLVDISAREIYEIKPDNASGSGLTQGTIEADRYVLKANQACPPAWHKGTTYPVPSPKLLPSGNPLWALQYRLGADGVVLYKYLNIPPPTPIPVGTVDKLKHLVKRVKDHLTDAERIITEFLRENPDLVIYLKTAAIGAAVSIVVGTIAEDLATAGVGIADDWASFALAYRIVRYAWAL